MKYKFDIPRSRGTTNDYILPQLLNIPHSDTVVKDVILHALIVRIAYTDGHTEEFYTKLGPDGTLEIDISDDRLDLLCNITIGPKIEQFIDWLIRRSTLIPSTVTITEDGTLTVNSSFTTVLIVASNGPINLILPIPSSMNIINVKRIDDSAYGVKIFPPFGTIDGDSFLEINIKNESYQLASDDTNYYIT